MDNPLTHNPFKGLPKPAIYASVVGGVGIGGYLVYRHHKTTGSWNPWSSGSAGAGTAQSGTDPITGMPYSDDSATDPLTGQQYLAEAQQYGSVAAAEAAVSAYGQSTATGSGIGVNPASPQSSGTLNTPVGSNVYTSNSAWAQAVEAGLTDVGYTSTDVATAIGDYLTGTPLTPAEATLVRTAIGEYGPAPVGNLQIIIAPVSTPGTTTTNTAPQVSHGHQVLPASPTTAVVAWTGTNADHYRVQLTGPGSSNASVQTVYQPQATFTDLEAGHNWSVAVTPYNTAGTAGQTGNIDFQTAKQGTKTPSKKTTTTSNSSIVNS